MLDQNTDRMWYVIGAIVIGAAIIAMGLNIFSESFGSVDGMMANLTGVASENVFLIRNNGIYTEEEIDNLINNEGYIPVATADELDNIRKSKLQTFGSGSKWESEYTSGLNGKYIQVSNINLGSFNNWLPIGIIGSGFSGVFDGGGFYISNLNINRTSDDYIGLFGYISESKILNVNVKDIDIVGYFHVGGVVGDSRNSEIYNTTSTNGLLRGYRGVGGVVGYLVENSKIDNSSSDLDISGRGRLGGLVGDVRLSTISSSVARGSIRGVESTIGNLYGLRDLKSTIERSSGLGFVTRLEGID